MKRLEFFSIISQDTPLGGIYIALIANRMQVLFFILVLPMYLVHPYMMFVMLAVGMLSQFNLYLLSKWLSSPAAAKGYEGFAALFGERKLRFLS